MSDTNNSSYSGRVFSRAGSYGAVDAWRTHIVPGLPGVQAFIKTLHATGGDAAAVAYAFKARYGLRTTVKTAAVDAATSLVLNGDDAGLINGYTPTTSDYVLVATNAGSADNIAGKEDGWRILTIGAVSVSAGSDQVTVSTLGGLDGHTGIEGSVSAGAVAYILKGSEMVSYLVGSGSIDKENVIAGEMGAPVGVILDPASGAAHDISISGEYR